jgi:predicted phage terminase large subunit-like protein
VAATHDGDYSVCTTWLIVGQHAYLIDLWRGRLEFPALLKEAIARAKAQRASTILVEKPGLGLSFYQALRNESGVGNVLGIDPRGTKIERLEGESPAIEGGYIHLPENAPWLADLLHELLGFPTAKYDDQVDSISQFLTWRRSHAATPNVPSTMLFGKLFEGDPLPY